MSYNPDFNAPNHNFYYPTTSSILHGLEKPDDPMDGNYRTTMYFEAIPGNGDLIRVTMYGSGLNISEGYFTVEGLQSLIDVFNRGGFR